MTVAYITSLSMSSTGSVGASVEAKNAEPIIFFSSCKK